MKLVGWLGGMLLLVPVDAAACSCAVPGLKDSFRQSAAVFVGRVVSIGERTAVIEVLESFKGVRPGETVEVLWFHGMCSYPRLTRGREHLLFAYRDGPLLSVSMCTWSAETAERTCETRLVRRRAWWWRTPLSAVPFRARELGFDPCAASR